MLTLKTAIGIEVRGPNLEFLCLKRRLRGLMVAGRMRLEQYRNLPPAEAGRQYRAFLKSQGLKTANAVVSLPRGEALLRVLTLPPEARRNLAKAIEYQVDSLHPFEEGGVYYDFATLDSSRPSTGLQVAVVMVEKKTADAYYEWFSQAGIAVSGFTVSAAALYGALNTASLAIVVDLRPGSLELLGFSSQALFSKEVPGSTALLERELAYCRAEMRLPPEAQPLVVFTGEALPERAALPPGYEPASIERLVPPPEAAPGAGFQLREHLGVYAAALAVLHESGHGFRVNLLPAEKRLYRSPWTYAPTYALAAVVVLILLALAGRGAVQDRLYLNHLNTQIRRLEPKVRYVGKLESQQRQMVDRIVLLDSMKEETRVRLRALAELSRVLPPTVWLQEAEFRDSAIILYGLADSASGLLGTLDDSPFFRNAEFLSAITKTAEGKEVFRIRMQLRTLLPAQAGDWRLETGGSSHSSAQAGPVASQPPASIPHGGNPASPGGKP